MYLYQMCPYGICMVCMCVHLFVYNVYFGQCKTHFTMSSMLIDAASSVTVFEPPKDHGRVPARVVIGAGQDRIVDQEGLQETARYLGVHALQLPTLCHDVMLVSEWRVAADLIAEQLIQISNSQ